MEHYKSTIDIWYNDIKIAEKGDDNISVIGDNLINNSRGTYIMKDANYIDSLITDKVITKCEKGNSVNHPKWYTSHPSGIECIEITRHYCFSIGNAIKYLWRAGLKAEEGMTDKDKEIQDLKKAIWYIKDRIKQLEGYDKERI